MISVHTAHFIPRTPNPSAGEVLYYSSYPTYSIPSTLIQPPHSSPQQYRMASASALPKPCRGQDGNKRLGQLQKATSDDTEAN